MSSKLWMIHCQCLRSRGIRKLISITVQIKFTHFNAVEHKRTHPSQVESNWIKNCHSPLMATPNWPPLLVPRCSIGTTIIFGFSSMPMSLRSCESGCFCQSWRCGLWTWGAMGQCSTVKLKKRLLEIHDQYGLNFHISSFSSLCFCIWILDICRLIYVRTYVRTSHPCMDACMHNHAYIQYILYNIHNI